MGYILDISDDQGEINWKELGAAKDTDGSPLIIAVVAQATEGLTVTNARFREYHDGAKTARPDGSAIPFGGYHFFYADDDGAAQAKHFLDFIDGYEGQVLPMEDYEEGGVAGQSLQTFIANAVEFDCAVRATLKPGKLPLIYGDLSFWSRTGYMQGYDGFSGHPFWVAAYNRDASIDVSSTAWKAETLWQMTDGEVGDVIAVPGISTTVDVSRLHPGLALAAILR